MFSIKKGEWIKASILYIFAFFGFSISNLFYDSCLLSVAPKKEEMDKVSALGYTLGYLGGGLHLLLSLIFMAIIADSKRILGMKLIFLSVFIWWGVFSLPFVLNMPQTYKSPQTFKIKDILREIGSRKEVILFLTSFWLYSDGIGSIVKLATLYGAQLGIGEIHLIGALLVTQAIGVPFTYLFGLMGANLGTKKAIILGLFVYLGIVIWGFFMRSAWEFWVLAAAVGTVQGGVQALSRSFFASLIPKEKTSSYFSFFTISSKLAGVFGPFLFAFISQVTKNLRWGVLSLALLFTLGIFTLSKVRVPSEAEILYS